MAEEVDYEEDEMNIQISKGSGEGGKGKDKSGDDNGKIKKKGRGHQRRVDEDDRYNGRGGVFERLEETRGPGPLQCKEICQSNFDIMLLFIVLLYSNRRMDYFYFKCTPRSN
jgi:hypothetical protein